MIKEEILKAITLMSERDLMGAIDGDMDLLSSFREEEPVLYAVAKMTIPTLCKEEIEEITTNNLLDCLREERPDLYSVFVNYHGARGIDWLDWNLCNFKTTFLKK